MPSYKRVTSRDLCPICEHDSWCSYSDIAIHCRRVKSPVMRMDKSGSPYWIHPFPGDYTPSQPVPQIKEPEKARKTHGDWLEIIKRMDYAEHKTEALARSLGVAPTALELLGVRHHWDSGGSYAFFPMRDDEFKIIGGVRRYLSGEKKTYFGSQVGLFMPSSLLDFPTIQKGIWIPEGASDVCAMISAGLPAIGRPSNTGGAYYLKRLKSRLNVKMFVMAERDHRISAYCKCKDPDYCNQCWPGKYGAIHVAKQIGASVVWPPEGFKDYRDYYTRRG